MKKLFTLAAAGTMAVASLSAQAQVVVDGVLNTTEIGSTGGYVLIGKFTNTRGFGDAGLLSLWAATSATKVTFFLAGTVEPNGKAAPDNPNGNAFQMYFKTPTPAGGVPAGTALPSGAAGTSFEKMNAKMDMPVNLAIAIHSDYRVAPVNSTYIVEGVSYTNATTATSGNLATAVPGTGAATTITSTTVPVLVGARVAYKATADGKLVGSGTTPSNPGAISPNTAAGYGAAGSYGLEFEFDRTATGLVGNATMQVFALQNNGDGGYLSTDCIPQPTTSVSNLATNPDFATIGGTQAATLNLTATSITLGNKAAAAAVALGVFPNPTNGSTTVSYRVAESSSPVRIALTDLMGRTVRVVESSVQNAGMQSKTFSTADVTAGTYLMRVQVGDNVATSKVSVL